MGRITRTGFSQLASTSRRQSATESSSSRGATSRWNSTTPRISRRKPIPGRALAAKPEAFKKKSEVLEATHEAISRHRLKLDVDPFDRVSAAELTPEHVHSLAKKIAPKISYDTGWPIDVSRVTFEILPAGQVFDKGRREYLRRMGISDEEDKRIYDNLGLFERITSRIEEWHDKHRLIACYLPSERKVLISKGAARRLTNQAFHSNLYHELVHVAQHQGSAIFESLEEIGKKMHHASIAYGDKSDPYLDLEDTFQARMTAIEGQATYLEQKYAPAPPEEEEPAWMDPTEVVVNVASSLLSLLPRDPESKMTQYSRGYRAFKRLDADKEVMQSLFANLDLVDLTFKTRGKVTVRYPKEEGSNVEVWRMLMACREVAGLREGLHISIERT